GADAGKEAKRQMREASDRDQGLPAWLLPPGLPVRDRDVAEGTRPAHELGDLTTELFQGHVIQARLASSANAAAKGLADFSRHSRVLSVKVDEIRCVFQ